MAEYINRKALLKKAWDADTRIGYVQVVDVGDILDMPVADVVPVVHGRWVEYQIPPIVCCSNCDWVTDVKEKNFQYCPNCGAKMNEKEAVYD